jgi:hypothetical protein
MVNFIKIFCIVASFLQDPLQNCANEIKQSMKEDPKYCQKLIATHAEVTCNQWYSYRN